MGDRNTPGVRPLGMVSSSAFSGLGRSAAYRTFTYAAFPDPFGAITAYLDVFPIVAVRVSA